jgi:hypothetical protein
MKTAEEWLKDNALARVPNQHYLFGVVCNIQADANAEPLEVLRILVELAKNRNAACALCVASRTADGVITHNPSCPVPAAEALLTDAPAPEQTEPTALEALRELMGFIDNNLVEFTGEEPNVDASEAPECTALARQFEALCQRAENLLANERTEMTDDYKQACGAYKPVIDELPEVRIRRMRDGAPERTELTPEIVQNGLLLVARPIPLEVIAAWTDEQQREAGEWSARVADSASDNDDVVVPPEPEWTKLYEVDFKGRYVCDVDADAAGGSKGDRA